MEVVLIFIDMKKSELIEPLNVVHWQKMDRVHLLKLPQGTDKSSCIVYVSSLSFFISFYRYIFFRFDHVRPMS